MDILLKTAIDAALMAGERLKSGFRSSFAVSFKEHKHNLVTEYDLASEQIIINHIKSIFPNHSFLSEEAGLKQSDLSDIQWIIDPLDGTVNFSHGIPLFSVSIAAVQQQNILCGVVYAPMTDELFYAEAGKGAFLNNQPIAVSDATSLLDAILVTGFPYNVHENPGNCIGHFSQFAHLGIPIRRLGSAAIDLAYIASGRFDGFWEVLLQPWDIAAGTLIVREAGGSVIDYQGNQLNVLQTGSLIATNGKLDSEILSNLALADIHFPKGMYRE